ncbi:hypothetical protein AWJ20_3649 [Sugiyamaella lignohabitans]|uniref:Dynactin subunit 4 n=1 Tax=Sugiyamaella lignohabitans TaxID=796027 RepID=A0A170QZ24_9ASCO|nr:uncharacterized protein AWJ20_3649 [Sugiyamaella lignohabitans]ANB15999.1 hypothetical protein AWJ20_3649 [Sugiyamaella lignohabitans]
MSPPEWRSKVRIFCACQVLQENPAPNNTDESDAPYGHIPSTLMKPWALHKLEYLYFCDHCKSTKCKQCVTQEVISRFCPSCLYEVTESSARASSNKCLRNCLQCPECGSSVVASSEGDTYKLNCNYCSWKNDPKLKLNKKVAIGLQVFNLYKENEGSYSRFEQIRGSVNSSLPKPVTSSLTTFRMNTNTKQHFEPFPEPIIRVIGSTDAHEIVLPKLVELRGKTSKRCKVCRRSLTKPDPRPSSIKFRNKSLAFNFLPSLFIEKPKNVPSIQNPLVTSSITSGQTFMLTITNSLPSKIQLNISTSQSLVTLIAPQVEIGPNSDSWDEESLIQAVPFSHISRQTNVTRRVFMEKERPNPSSTMSGIHDKGPNWVTVPIEISTLNGNIDTSLDIPLFLSISYEESVDEVEHVTKPSSSKLVRIGVWYVLTIHGLDGIIANNPEDL